MLVLSSCCLLLLMAKVLETQRRIDMDDTVNIDVCLDQTEEDILTYEVSDEALEQAAGALGVMTEPFQLCSAYC
jgi:hypothetical protein